MTQLVSPNRTGERARLVRWALGEDSYYGGNLTRSTGADTRCRELKKWEELVAVAKAIETGLPKASDRGAAAKNRLRIDSGKM